MYNTCTYVNKLILPASDIVGFVYCFVSGALKTRKTWKIFMMYYLQSTGTGILTNTIIVMCMS